MVKGKAFRNTAKEARKGTHQRSSAKNVSKNAVTFEERQKQKRLQQDITQMQKEFVDSGKEKAKERIKKLEAKRKRKEENEVKAGIYQVISKTDKIRKWQKKAKKTLLKMSSENIEKILNRNK